ncbi:translocation protein TolB [bacterium BMS3Abin07]|nr:translocation protein TolB [bacterium BMS3Abin07]GBE32366.1 translocation protein TolB [bacterium BMS3Bbin05]
MKKLLIPITCILVFFIVICLGHEAYAKIYIDIDSPALRQFPMALYDFGEDKIGQELTGIVRNDLEFTRLFYFVRKEAFIEEKGDDFNPADWSPIGVEAVLKGDITVTDKINVVVRLYDVVETKIILYKQYISAKPALRSLAHRISNDIYYALTGRKGIFNTKIAFVSKGSKIKELVMMDFDGARLHKTGFRKSMMLALHASADGSSLIISASGGRQWSIYLLNFTKGSVRRIFSSKGINIAGDFFSGGKSFVFSSSKDGSPDIYVFDIASGRSRRLTSSYWIDISPSLSPDDRSIAFVSDRSGNPNIYTMSINGDNVQRVTFEDKYNTSPSWSPAGDLIAYSGLVKGKNQIFTVKPDATNARQLTDSGNNEEPDFSPDGRFITFTSDRDGYKAIYIMTTGGENQRRVSPHGYRAFGPEWLSN